MIKKFLYFFNKYQKISLSLLFGFMLVSTIFEMVGLGFIFSIVGALSPVGAESNLFINKISAYFQIEINKHFVTFSHVFFLLSNE